MTGKAITPLTYTPRSTSAFPFCTDSEKSARVGKGNYISQRPGGKRVVEGGDQEATRRDVLRMVRVVCLLSVIVFLADKGAQAGRRPIDLFSAAWRS